MVTTMHYTHVLLIVHIIGPPGLMGDRGDRGPPGRGNGHNITNFVAELIWLHIII